MHVIRSLIPLAAAVLASACTTMTPGSQAPVQGQSDCVKAAARYYKVPAETIEVVSSQVGMAATLYEVTLRHGPSGRQAKCTVDQNGTVTGVAPIR